MNQRKNLSLVLASAILASTAAAAPGLLNYQGRLTDSAGTPVTTARNVTFTLWGAQSGGSQLGGAFTDTDTVTPDAHGLYSTEIGDEGGPLVPSQVFDNDAVWLNVNVAGEDLAPRLRITSAGYAAVAARSDVAADSDALQGRDAAAFLNMASDAYVVVQTTASATDNGANLLAAYSAAKALTPHGAARSAANRAALVVPPGIYDLTTASLTLDAEYVDLTGLTPAREKQVLLSAADTLVQTADDVRIEALTLSCTGSGSDTVSYRPVGGSPAATVIRNCIFQSVAFPMEIGAEYAGTYENCLAVGYFAFGGNGGTASGKFTGCTGGLLAFGGGGTASGRFTDCTGGDNSFAGGGTASGTFTNCTGGFLAFGGEGAASGKFTECSGDFRAFAGGGGAASGTFTDCTGGSNAFGAGGTATGTFARCTGGDSSFGSGGSADNGKFYHCVGGVGSFTESGTPSPRQIFCIHNGSQYTNNN